MAIAELIFPPTLWSKEISLVGQLAEFHREIQIQCKWPPDERASLHYETVDWNWAGHWLRIKLPRLDALDEVLQVSSILCLYFTKDPGEDDNSSLSWLWICCFLLAYRVALKHSAITRMYHDSLVHSWASISTRYSLKWTFSICHCSQCNRQHLEPMCLVLFKDLYKYCK